MDSPALCMIYLRGNEAAREGRVPPAWVLGPLPSESRRQVVFLVCLHADLCGEGQGMAFPSPGHLSQNAPSALFWVVLEMSSDLGLRQPHLGGGAARRTFVHLPS